MLREDQLETAKKLLNLLREGGITGLQAPTGWGKSYVAAYIARELGGKWAWASSLISALTTASSALREFGVKSYLSVGRERLCTRGYRHADFIVRKPCTNCQLNTRPPRGMVKALIGATDYSEVKGLAEEGGLCPYNVQEALIKELLSKYDDVVILMNYGRLGKYAERVGGIIIDEAHNAVIPRLVTIPRKTLEQLLDRLGVRGIDARNAEVVKGVLSEHLLTIAMDEEANELVNLDDAAALVESQVAYYDQDQDAVIGVRVEGLPQINGKRVILMSATLPPSILQSMPVVRIEPTQHINAIIPRGAIPITVQSIQNQRDKITALLREYLNEPAVIFTTSSKDVYAEGVVYESDVRSIEEVCGKATLVLNYFGRFSEGVRLNKCFRKAILYTLPLLPPHVMRRLRARGVSEEDLAVLKTVQAIGRVLPNEDAEVILLDKRFKQYCAALMNYGIQCIDKNQQ